MTLFKISKKKIKKGDQILPENNAYGDK